MRTKRAILALVATVGAVLLTSGVVIAAAPNGADEDDSIDGTASADVLRGEEGEDTIDGGAGNDTLFADDEAKHTRANPVDDSDDVMQGEQGDDTIVGSAGANELEGGDGADNIVTGPGNDTAVDQVFGGDGDDEIDAVNTPPSRDVIDCGGGTDHVMVDLLDEVNNNCEEVEIVQPPDTDMVPESQ